MTEVKDIVIGPQELVFNKNNDFQSGGGFSVGDILNKSGISTIMTTRVDAQTGGSINKVSDLFQHLAVPSWATMYNMHGGEYKKKKDDESDSDSDSESDIDDDLHDKLLALVREHENKLKPKNKKSSKRNKNEKKNTTKKMKI
jgi:hypothetical protein